MLKQRNYNEMVTYILDKIRKMDISEDDKKALFAYITSLECKYFMEMGNEQRWIPCSERLPEENTEVLITDDDGDLAIAEYYLLHNSYVEWWSSSHRIFPIAWMELPRPYKEEIK